MDCLKSNGKDLIETRILSSFETIKVNDFFNVYLIQDSVYKVIIEGSENINSLIETKIDNKTLYLRNNNKCNWSRKYKTNNIYIHSPHFKHIYIVIESNLFSLNTITTDTFHVDVRASIAKVNVKLNASVNMLDIHAGTGDFTYSGTVNNNYLYCHGTAFLWCKNLVSDYTGITQNSTGDFYVNCRGLIDANLFGTGNVYYTGNPSKINIISQTSTGEILPM